MCAAFVRDAAVDNPIPVFPLPKIAFIRQNEKWRVCGFCVEVAGGILAWTLRRRWLAFEWGEGLEGVPVLVYVCVWACPGVWVLSNCSPIRYSQGGEWKF